LTQWGWDCLWYCVPGRPWHFAAHVRSLSPKACCAHYYVLNIMGHLGHAAFPLNYQASLWHLSTGCTMETPWACLQDFAFIVSTCSLAHWVSGLSVWTECLEWVSGLECLDLSVWTWVSGECLDLSVLTLDVFGCLWSWIGLGCLWSLDVFGGLWMCLDLKVLTLDLSVLRVSWKCLEWVSGLECLDWVSGVYSVSGLNVWTEFLDWVSGLNLLTRTCSRHWLFFLSFWRACLCNPGGSPFFAVWRL
jgi:hypothetical protein